MITVAIVEHDPVVRWRVAGAIALIPELRLVGAVGTEDDGVGLAYDYMPDVMLVGTTLADAPGLAAAKQLRHSLPEVVLGVITADATDDTVTTVILAGAAAQ